MHATKLFLLTVYLLLQSCAMTQVGSIAYSGYLSPGAIIEVREALPLKRGKSRLFLQDGELLRLSQVDRFYPHCNFEVRKLATSGERIEPGRFRVTRVTGGEEQVVQTAPVRVASIHLNLGYRSRQGGPAVVSRFYHYHLTSQAQPNVLRLTCHGGEKDQPEALLPTLTEIRIALGEMVRVIPNSSS